jgi:hypothetical protein
MLLLMGTADVEGSTNFSSRFDLIRNHGMCITSIAELSDRSTSIVRHLLSRVWSPRFAWGCRHSSTFSPASFPLIRENRNAAKPIYERVPCQVSALLTTPLSQRDRAILTGETILGSPKFRSAWPKHATSHENTEDSCPTGNPSKSRARIVRTAELLHGSAVAEEVGLSTRRFRFEGCLIRGTCITSIVELLIRSATAEELEYVAMACDYSTLI